MEKIHEIDKYVMRTFHKELQQLENWVVKYDKKVPFGIQEQQLVGICLRILNILDIKQIRQMSGMTNATLMQIENIFLPPLKSKGK